MDRELIKNLPQNIIDVLKIANDQELKSFFYFSLNQAAEKSRKNEGYPSIEGVTQEFLKQIIPNGRLVDYESYRDPSQIPVHYYRFQGTNPEKPWIYKSPVRGRSTVKAFIRILKRLHLEGESGYDRSIWQIVPPLGEIFILSHTIQPLNRGNPPPIYRDLFFIIGESELPAPLGFYSIQVSFYTHGSFRSYFNVRHIINQSPAIEFVEEADVL